MLGARKERSADACRDGARARFVAVRRLCSLPKQAELSWKESSLISARRCNLAIGAAFVLRSTTRWPTIHEKQAVRLLFNKEHDAAPATTFSGVAAAALQRDRGGKFGVVGMPLAVGRRLRARRQRRSNRLSSGGQRRRVGLVTAARSLLCRFRSQK